MWQVSVILLGLRGNIPVILLGLRGKHPWLIIHVVPAAAAAAFLATRVAFHYAFHSSTGTAFSTFGQYHKP